MYVNISIYFKSPASNGFLLLQEQVWQNSPRQIYCSLVFLYNALVEV